ncbi:MAG: hypothetical protein GY805_21345 [Chloroflexi bacterium]|nr:hypothetical protein [Chloroflexota bacterium]
MKIVTIKEFTTELFKLLDKHDQCNRSLQEYLQTLWAIALENQNHSLSSEMILHMLAEAFTRNPANFESQWLDLTKMPYWNYKDDMYLIEGFRDGKSVILERNITDFEIFRRVILFQIADLSRFDEAVFNDPDSYYGIDSPTRNRWYNLDLKLYLKCAASYLIDVSRGGDVPYEEVDWVDLAWILKAGMSYE